MRRVYLSSPIPLVLRIGSKPEVLQSVVCGITVLVINHQAFLFWSIDHFPDNPVGTVFPIPNLDNSSSWLSFDSFNYTFLDTTIAQMYQAEQRMNSIFKIFACFTLFISCLGLFGLSAYAAELRTKEIGIRKVLGATERSIVGLLSRDFVKLVMIAILVGSFLAWYFMQQWLQGFAYRIHISWWIFVLAGLTATVIALATISFHAIRAALRNPVKNMRIE